MRFLVFYSILVLLFGCSKDGIIEPVTNQPTASLFVSADASSGGDGSEMAPFQSIQAAIDAAQDGEVILVRTGQYQESVSIRKSNLTLLAESNVQLQYDGFDAVFFITGNQVVVNGFEIANSNTDDLGAIHVSGATNVQLINNHIHDNQNAAAYWLVGTTGVIVDGGQLVDNRGGVRIDSATYDLTIRNVEIFSSEIVISQQGSTAESSQYFGILNGWEPVGGSNWLIENVTIRGTVTYGIELRSRSETYPQENPIQNLVIRNCLLEQNGYGYAAEGWPAHEYAPEYYYGNVLIQGLDGVLVENCIFRDGGDWGIDFYKTDNVIVRNNLFLNNGALTPQTEIGDGLEVNGGRNNKIFNNVFYGNPNSGLFLSYIIETQGELHSPTSLVANNIGWNNGEGDLSIFGPTEEDPYQGFFATHTLHHNLFGTRGIYGPLNEMTPMEQNPDFVNPASFDFALGSGSVARDQGWLDDPDIPTLDFDGNPRPQGLGIDLGIYEY